MNAWISVHLQRAFECVTAWVLFGLVGAACSDRTSTLEVEDVSDVAEVALCRPNQCEVGGRCLDDGDRHPDDPCRACLVARSTSDWSPRDGESCDDGDACTQADRCEAGLCQGTALCADNDPCTEDTCLDGVCRFMARASETCVDPCASNPSCDDDEVCTEDRCEPQIGCVHDPKPGACDDGESCTVGDRCEEGRCVGEPRCDDGNACTFDVCAAGGCEHRPLDSLCDDGSICTQDVCDPDQGCVYTATNELWVCGIVTYCTGEICIDGRCQLYVDPIPSDNNSCTDDLCNETPNTPNDILVYAPNDEPCDDGNECTFGDTCGQGSCQPGTTLRVCDDGNACTTDSCVRGRGCVFTPNTTACDDGNACTVSDRCGGGRCSGTPRVCDDQEACTTDSCQPDGLCLFSPITSAICRPTITVTTPARAATITTEDDEVTFVGRVVSPGSSIATLTLNGSPVAVRQDGAFEVDLPHQVGGNTAAFLLTDRAGRTDEHVQSFLASPSYRRPLATGQAMVDDGVGTWISRTVLDDGRRGLPANDLASIVDLVVGGFDLDALMPSPAAAGVSAGGLIGTYDVFLDDFALGPHEVLLTPKVGGISLLVRYRGASAGVRAVKTCSSAFGACNGPDLVTGDLDVVVIDALLDLELTVVDNNLVVVPTRVDVVLSGVSVEIDGALGWLIEFILSFMQDDFVARAETLIEGEITRLVVPLTRQALNGFLFSPTLSIPRLGMPGRIPVQTRTNWRSITCQPSGCRVVLKGGATTNAVVTNIVNSGIPSREKCGGRNPVLTVPTDAPLTVTLPDDLVNQVLFALWRGGLLEFDVPTSWYADFDLTELGVSQLALHVSAKLAPTLSDCGGPVEVHLGDVRVDVTLQMFGQPVSLVVFASLDMAVGFSLSERSVLVQIGALRRAAIQVEVSTPTHFGLEPVIDELIETRVVPYVMEALQAEPIGSFPLPDIDLGGSVGGLPAGTAIRIAPTSIERFEGQTIVRGNLQ